MATSPIISMWYLWDPWTKLIEGEGGGGQKSFSRKLPNLSTKYFLELSNPFKTFYPPHIFVLEKGSVDVVSSNFWWFVGKRWRPDHRNGTFFLHFLFKKIIYFLQKSSIVPKLVNKNPKTGKKSPLPAQSNQACSSLIVGNMKIRFVQGNLLFYCKCDVTAFEYLNIVWVV